MRNSGSQHVKRVGTRLVWKKKEIGLYAAHSAITTTQDGIWYFDSGCSRHMTGSAACLIDLSHSDGGGQVTFGDGAKGVVLGCGTLALEGMPSLTGVLLVKGLKANLISISQLCDQNLAVQFTKEGCFVSDSNNQSVLQGVRTADNCYQLQTGRQCNYSTTSDMNLWHRRLGHIHDRGLQNLIRFNAVRGLPKISGHMSGVCKGCMEGKQPRTSHPNVPYVTTSLPLELLHMDLMGPVHTPSIAGKRYVFRLMSEKQTIIGKIVRIRSDHGREFENLEFAQFCNDQGITHEFSARKTSQQDGVVERKKRTLQEMARTMIHAKNLPHWLWAEAVHTVCHIVNRVYLRAKTQTTSYELWKGRSPQIHYFREFGAPCYVLRDREYLSKFDSRSKEGIFVGYSRNSHAYRVYFKQSNTIIESVNVRIDDQEGWLVNDDDVNLDSMESVSVGSSVSVSETVSQPENVTPAVEVPEIAVGVPPCDTVPVTTMIQPEKDTLHETTERTPSIRV
ncbi:hypothetical protein H6P81_010299 [Aristolochia fimbriata]|uniref:Integrase catalytic domain-containing protein n=1 Tax=Aristolochia fimbriata TaxID=158543 RepID=A0AAV7EP00_ARIFI|nr:hypothetical protein H6P81_010299 [Aristolochia fimbriata]